ncbi:MAG TPA: dihydrolipoamide acetyltransferase family protein [Gemmatimonadales bacterium]|nr:dihydrolipoamide acetyltransferase family protein [Gemmatimonadales bacterium]
MPSLGADMAAGTLLEWLKQPGDRVARGDLIAEVDTDKGVIQVEAFTTGTLERILVEPGQKVPVGTVMALIRDDAVTAPAAAPPGAGPPAAGPLPQRVSPLARRRAQELGVDLASIQGTGAEGAVTVADVERLARGAIMPTATPAVDDSAARMRGAIGAAMARSKREIPHYYLSNTIDLGPAMAWLAEQNQSRPVADRLVAAALLLKSVALALRDFPELNAWWVNDRAVRQPSINLGVAVSLRQGGLIVPALEAADQASVDELMRRLTDLVARAKGGALRASELASGTLTVTSLGDRGVDIVLGVIYPPQVALVGFGRIAERPWVVQGAVLPRPVVSVSLSADHRVTDGHRGALFLDRIDQLLREPGAL